MNRTNRFATFAAVNRKNRPPTQTGYDRGQSHSEHNTDHDDDICMFGLSNHSAVKPLQRPAPMQKVLKRQRENLGLEKFSTGNNKKNKAGGGSKSVMTGWLSSSKTDKEIKASREVALNARRQRMGRSSRVLQKNAIQLKPLRTEKKTTTKFGRMKYYQSDEEKDDEQIDDFIVDNDEDRDVIDVPSSESTDEASFKDEESVEEEFESSSSEDDTKNLSSRKGRASGFLRKPVGRTTSTSRRAAGKSSQNLSSPVDMKKSRFFAPKKKSRLVKKSSATVINLDSDEDEDSKTEFDIDVSMSQKKEVITLSDDDSDKRNHSTRSTAKKGKGSVKGRGKKTKKTFFSDDSSVDDKGNDDEIEIYEVESENEESKEAGSVLRTTNKLSSFILAQMTEWCTSSEDKKTVEVQKSLGKSGSFNIGSISRIDSDRKHSRESSTRTVQLSKGIEFSAKPQWISREEVSQFCPGLRLSDYQLIGLNWLALLYTLTYRVEETGQVSHVNGILADEMGLGKTVQCIVFLAWLRHRRNCGLEKKGLGGEKRKNKRVSRRRIVDDDDDGSVEGSEIESDDCVVTDSSMDGKPRNQKAFVRPHLIIVPASVITNWMNEFQKFCPDMVVVKYHGSQDERQEIQSRLRKSFRTSLQQEPLDVVLTTFSYFSSEVADDRNFLRKLNFDYMVVDEAHCLKNAKGARYRNMAKFQTTHRLLLTGTPVQNSPKELMCLLCFLMPLFKHSRTEEDDDGGQKMLDHFVTLQQANQQALDSQSANGYKKLKQLLAPFVLRRRKVEVLAQMLPPKTRKLEAVPMDETGRKIYDSLLASYADGRSSSFTESPKKLKFSDASANNHLFTSLRKAANHPLLLRTRYLKDKEKKHMAYHFLQNGFFGRDATCTFDLVKKELDGFSDYAIHCACLEMIEENPLRKAELERYCLKEDDLYSSAKLIRLRSLIPQLIQDGHRILMFSQWTMCLDILEAFLDSLSLKYLRLDGKTPIVERQNMIDEFNRNDSIPVFLLSTRAGGMGINLTAADVCILHDLDFNPFNDLQAEDRCHRIGQKKPVTVIKLVTEGTVDEAIYNMQERKAQMNAAILDNDYAVKPKSKVTEKREEKEEINSMLQNAMEKFLSSPVPK